MTYFIRSLITLLPLLACAQADEQDVIMREATVEMASAGYDPCAFLAVLTTIDSINPQSAELAAFMNTLPLTGERLDTRAIKMDGKLDSYAAGVDNAVRFREVAAIR